MSSLKDIMNIEEEPLQPRNFLTNQQQEVNIRSLPQLPQPDTRYKDSRYSAQPPRLPPIEALPISTSTSTRPLSSSSITRKRSRRSSKTPTVSALGLPPGPSPAAGPDPNLVHFSSPARRRTSLGTEYMDSRYSQERSISPGAGYSSSNSNMGRGELRRGTDLSEIGERRTPVTGRISKAKKGLPVHDCPICGDSRKPFSRAEHLRRHMQTHEPPSFHCTEQSCGKSFHRKDLLERHLERHNEGQPANQMQDNGRRSRSVSTGYMKMEPPHTPPQQRFNAEPMNMDAPATSFSMNNASLPVPVSPMNGNMNLMDRYSPVSPHTYRGRNASATENQSFIQIQQYEPSQQLGSPISLSTDAPAHYAHVSPIVTCAGTSPMVTYATSSSLPAYSMSMMNASSYPSSNGFNPYTSVPMSCPDDIHNFSPQATRLDQVSQRLAQTQNFPSVDVPHSTPAHPNSHSPVYHSGSDSTWSTPSDMSKTHTWPPAPRNRAFSAPDGYTPAMDMSVVYQQRMATGQQIRQYSNCLAMSFEDQAMMDDDCYPNEVELSQNQYEANGGAPVQQGYMEDFQEWQGQWQGQC